VRQERPRYAVAVAQKSRMSGDAPRQGMDMNCAPPRERTVAVSGLGWRRQVTDEVSGERRGTGGGGPPAGGGWLPRYRGRVGFHGWSVRAPVGRLQRRWLAAVGVVGDARRLVAGALLAANLGERG
jgi:hypothetical protein